MKIYPKFYDAWLDPVMGNGLATSDYLIMIIVTLTEPSAILHTVFLAILLAVTDQSMKIGPKEGRCRSRILPHAPHKLDT